MSLMDYNGYKKMDVFRGVSARIEKKIKISLIKHQYLSFRPKIGLGN